MISFARRFTLLSSIACLIGFGCSSKSNTSSGGGPTKSDVLREVGGLIGSYCGENRKAPAKVADLARYEPGFPLGFQAVKSGDVVVVWGASITVDEGGGSSGGSAEVVAHEKKVPTEGGLVLLQNGSVKEMTPAEFAATPKAKK